MTDHRELLEHLMRAYEAGGGASIRADDWPRLNRLLERLDRGGSATNAEAAWLRDLEEQATYSLAYAEVSGPGRDKAMARARLADAYLRRRRATSSAYHEPAETAAG